MASSATRDNTTWNKAERLTFHDSEQFGMTHWLCAKTIGSVLEALRQEEVVIPTRPKARPDTVVGLSGIA